MISVYSREVVGYNTRRYCVPPKDNNLQNYGTHNQNIGIHTIHPFSSDLPSFTFTRACVYIKFYAVLSHVVSCIHHHSKDSKQFHHHKVPSCCSFITIPTPPPTLSPQNAFLTIINFYNNHN